jgi:hypothetical protein
MASGLVNIRRDVDDKFYRYRYATAYLAETYANIDAACLL